MKICKYDNFIPQNIAQYGVARIGVYDSKGTRVGCFGLQNLQFPHYAKKLYSFGALSDVHIRHSTAKDDFKKALTFLTRDYKVDFTCICGDLISGSADNPQTTELAEYKYYVDTYSPNTPVYAIAGNHESWGTLAVADIIESYTGHPLYYSFTQGDDVFIMLGIKQDAPAKLFANGELQWLYETLEANRNKRCFVFEHVRPDDVCGNAYGIYSYDIWDGTEKTIFENLMRHYSNIILFHGHSHLKFNLQTKNNLANYDNIFGCHSVHIPSISVPRTGDVTGANSRVEIYADSEGYVVEVYENGIYLRGRDFAKGEFLPIASYWLDTTLKDIPAKTFTDSTGTIKTN